MMTIYKVAALIHMLIYNKKQYYMQWCIYVNIQVKVHI